MKSETTYSIPIIISTADPLIVQRLRDEITALLQSIRPLEASYQVGLAVPRRDPAKEHKEFVQVLGELCK